MVSTIRSQQRWGKLFILPALVVYVFFLLIPLLFSFALSLFAWDGLGKLAFNGLDNFKTLIFEANFWNAVQNNLEFAIYTIIFGNSIALFFAILLESRIGGKRVKGKDFYRFLLFSQFILSWVVVSFLWKRILNPFDGLLNQVLKGIGLSSLSKNWLGDPSTALPSISFTAIWKGFGFGLVTYSAAIQSISEEVMDAARIDGASQWQINTKIIIPLLKPIIGIIVMLQLIDAFRVIDPIVIMATGTPMKSVQVIGVYIYKTAFDYYQMGYSSALSVALFFIVTVISVAYFILQKKSSND